MIKDKIEGSVQDFLIVATVFVVSLVACLVVFEHERQRNFLSNDAQFEQESRVIEYNLKDTFDGYAHVLRGGVALFEATDKVDRQTWHAFISNLELEKYYPGILGVGFNPALHDRVALDAFVEIVRETDVPSFEVRPDGERDLYTPILFLEPFEGASRAALGFDIYSEGNRREAINRAIETGEAHMTSKILLVQGDGVQEESARAGVLVVLPVFADEGQNREDVQGLVVSVFRIRDLMETILVENFENSGVGLKNVTLQEVTPSGEELLMFDRIIDDQHVPAYSFENEFELYGRVWRLVTASTAEYEAGTSRNSHRIILLAGIFASLLLTFLVWAQAVRSREAQRTAEKLAQNNKHIALLLKEVNHRSKNLLGLIQAIARQTSAGDPEHFSESFGRRLSALATSQDLLVQNGWRNLDLSELIKAQLGHFSGLIGSRILISGPKAEIDAQNAQMLSMTFHELATNASKYGALSNEDGLVEISWSITGKGAEAEFKLHWIERGGPPVTAPTRQGFGSKVTGMMVRMAFQGDVTLDYKTDGLDWRLTCAVQSLTANLRDNIQTDEGAAA